MNLVKLFWTSLFAIIIIFITISNRVELLEWWSKQPDGVKVCIIILWEMLMSIIWTVRHMYTIKDDNTVIYVPNWMDNPPNAKLYPILSLTGIIIAIVPIIIGAVKWFNGQLINLEQYIDSKHSK